MLSRSPSGFSRFCRNRLNTFSTSTIESSTSEPMAMAIPPRLIVLIVSPIQRMARSDATIESGMETSEITVVRQFIRNMNSTMITKIAPSIKDCFTLSNELSMKRDWRNIRELTLTSAGRLAFSSSKALSSLPVSASVLVLGCFVTVSSTAGFPSLEATPRTGVFGPMRTSATASSVIGSPFSDVLTTAFFISSKSLVDRRPRTIYSLPYS